MPRSEQDRSVDDGNASVTSLSTARTTVKAILQAIKYTYSMALLCFCMALVVGLILQHQTRLSQAVHPAVSMILIGVCIIWMSMVEGGQGALVGLPPVQRVLYEESHPVTLTCTQLAHYGDNLDRYLMGRQFLVVLIVFVTNIAGAPLQQQNDDADTEEKETVFGLPDWVDQVFLSSGLALILMTVIMGQLTSQVNASHCMLDYINNYFMVFTLHVALLIEASGLLHASYLVQMLVSNMSGQPIESQEADRNLFQNVLFWGRCLMSLAILAYSFAVTLSALFDGQTTLWEGIPAGIAVVIFFVLMCLVGLLEGMQIAFFAVTKLTKDEQAQHPMARKTCDLLFDQDGRNLPGFMIGRQMCVTMCFFFIARVTSLNVQVDRGDDTVFGVSNAAQGFFNTGLLGAIITTILGSISWQLLASAFPVAFLSNPLVYLLLRWCLFLESTGICSASWVLASVHKTCAGFKMDETYIGTPEERAAANKHDNQEAMDVTPGHMYPGVPVLPHRHATKSSSPTSQSGVRTGASPVGRRIFEQDEAAKKKGASSLPSYVRTSRPQA